MRNVLCAAICLLVGVSGALAQEWPPLDPDDDWWATEIEVAHQKPHGFEYELEVIDHVLHFALTEPGGVPLVLKVDLNTAKTWTSSSWSDALFNYASYLMHSSDNGDGTVECCRTECKSRGYGLELPSWNCVDPNGYCEVCNVKCYTVEAQGCPPGYKQQFQALWAVP